MYLIQGSNELYINNNLKILDKNNTIQQQYNKKIIQIKLYNQIITISKESLFYIAKLKMYIKHPMILSRLSSFEFFTIKQTRLKINTTKLIVTLKVPITIKHNNNFYRVISINTRYAVSMDGIILDLETYELVKSHYRVSGYPTIGLINYNGIRTTRLLHRLISFAWVKNEDWVKFSIVNHIDGNKLNYAISNLEWVDYKDNNIHAIESGLRTSVKSIMVKNIKTGVVVELRSITEACDYMGRSRMSTTSSKIIGLGKLVYGSNGIYELKYIDDKTPWISDIDSNKLITTNQRIKFHIHIDNHKFICNTVNDINDVISKHLTPKISFANDEFKNSIKKFIRNYKTIPTQIEYLNDKVDDYICIDTINNITKVVKNRKDIIDLTNGSKSAIQKAIATNGKYLINGWVVKMNDGKPHDEPANIANKAIRLQAYNESLNKTIIFDSFRKAGEYFYVDKSSIMSIVKSKNKIDGYKLTKLN